MTTKGVEAEVTPAAEAEIESVPAQPLSLYDPVATPATVATPVLITALPVLLQVDVKVTDCGVVTRTPPLRTVTVTLVVPNADNGDMATTGREIMTADAPTANPIDPVTAAGGEPTCAVAVMVVAPEARPTALSVTDATPAASVRAVAAGVIVAKVASVVKVTTEFGTTAPAAFLSVALTVAGEALAIDVTGAPAAVVKATVSEGVGVVVVVLVELVDALVVSVPGVVELDPPPPQPLSIAAARRSNEESLDTLYAENRPFEKFRTFNPPYPRLGY